MEHIECRICQILLVNKMKTSEFRPSSFDTLGVCGIEMPFVSLGLLEYHSNY